MPVQTLETDKSPKAKESEEAWQVLVVDDDRDIHALTSIILNDFQHQNRPLEIHYARTTKQAMDVLSEKANIHLVLLDMVMEDRDSGLKIIQHIRTALKNSRTQVVVRTAVREMLPAQELIDKYQILDAKVKSDMTAHVFRETILQALEKWQAVGKSKGVDPEFLIIGLSQLKDSGLTERQNKIVQDLLDYLNIE
jgi:CheY-like chemotaxis protein